VDARYLTFLVFSSFLWLSGCAQPRPVLAQGDSGIPSLNPLSHSREANDFARFVAGLPGTEGSPFLSREADSSWQAHRAAMNAGWAEASKTRIEGLTEFQRNELNRRELDLLPVFYPFGGPDALTATTYFPHNAMYVLVGLEPAGTLPTFSEIAKKKDLTAYLQGLRASLTSEVGHSFFVTKEMDREYRGQIVDGVLVPILDLLVRSGHTILGYRYIRLDEHGKIVARPANFHGPGKIGNKAIDIEFRTDADASVHRILYFSVNLSDARLRNDPQFLAYLSGLKNTMTLLKATSYMPHHRDFTMIRDAILSRSAAILQDDSGIPFHFFTTDRWDVKLYGGYTRPYGSFRWMEQADLRKAYVEKTPHQLPMAVGYGYRRIPSNLQLALRRSTIAR